MSSTDRKLRFIKTRKRSIIASLAVITRFVDNFDVEQDITEVPVRLESLVELWTEYRQIMSEWEDVEEDDEIIEAYLTERAQLENTYYRVKGLLLSYNLTTPQTTSRHQESSRQSTQVKLPDLKLPIFSGDYESWLNFHDLFTSLVHSSENLSLIQKFYYLRASLSGEALKLIQTIPISSDQYNVAWQVLIEHFQNPRRLKRTYIQSLFEFPSIKREAASELNSLTEKFQANVRILKQLGERTEHWDALLIHLLSIRLDPVTRRDWEEYAENNDIVNFQGLIEFLQRRVNVLQLVASKPSDTQQQSITSKKPITPRAGNHGAIQKSSRNCSICSGGQHSLYQCGKFAKMSTEEKERIVRQQQLCRNCLRRGHLARNCSSESNCRKCNGRHHTQLCGVSRDNVQNRSDIKFHTSDQNNYGVESNTSENTASSNPAVHSGVTSHSSTQHSNGNKVLLATAIVLLIDDTGNEQPVRALLDSGSECCFATERVNQLLKVHRTKVNMPIVGIGHTSTQVRHKIRSTLKSRIGNFTAPIDLFILPKVTIDLPSVAVNVSAWEIPTGIQLADPSFYEPGTIDVVLGAELFFDCFNVAGRIPLGESLPCLVNSVFGWVVTGKTGKEALSSHFTCNIATTTDIQRDMERFWSIEDDSIQAYSPTETFCEQHFTDNVSRGSDGRYIVRLPIKVDSLHKLGDNRRTAFHRFRLLEGRLNRDPKLADEYRKFMREYIDLGHMERIESNRESSHSSFFLPHHPVIRESSSTTRVRVVFDASCKCATGMSLNDAMSVGPIIQEDLRSVIMRARLHAVMLIADIAKMFRQVRLHPDDTPLQRIFWRCSTSEPIQVYELKTVTYGTASAPFLATRVLRQLANDEKENYPAAATATGDDFYVDDFYSGTRTVEDAVNLQAEMEAMFRTAGMELRKWASNCSEALKNVPAENRALSSTVDFDKDQSIKTLGLHWEPGTDKLKYSIQNHFDDELPITKRSTLSCIAKLFDPLGLVGPVVMRAKIFMQALWTLKGENGKPMDWDHELPKAMRDCWTSYYTELNLLNDLRINRLVTIPSAIRFELHFFSDASNNGYGSCCYVRSTNDKSETMVALLTSRSKVSPLKQQSIPRLELCGALMSAELYTKVTKSLRIDANAIFWVDSTTVLSWLNSPPSTWTTFVGNRVSKIQHATEGLEWNHVAGLENPADLISRGVAPKELIDRQLWWEGPTWLKQQQNTWPVYVRQGTESEAMKEARKFATTAAAQPTCFIEEHISQFSKYQNLLRVTALCCRYLANLRSPRPNRSTAVLLKTEELRQAELTIIRLVQQNAFPAEWKILQRGQTVSNKSPLRWFHPIIGQGNIIRVGGRLGQSELSYDQKHQIILPKSHVLSILIIRNFHERLLHAAPQLLLCTLRQRFWILGGRTTVRRIVHACVTCYRAKPKVVEQFMAELPTKRVTASRPFSVVGIDFWGPIYLQPRHRRDSPPKAYVAVFVCFSTKAVHMELVVDLTTVKMLQAFRRFVSRRGLCSDVYTDNGKNFVGAANELRRLLRHEDFSKKFAHECSSNGIRWHFNPPRASHFGGLWEAAIHSAQKHFVRVLGDRKLTFDDMETLLTQIECCLNSRPLTKLTDDPSDMEPLTPGHFITGTALKSVPDVNYESIPFNRLRQWQQTQKILQDVWKRWQREYLSSLQPRTKWYNPPVQLEINQLVVIMEENQPPMHWAMARIHKLHPGKDGVVRVVTLQTATGLLTRPVAKICVLPIPPSSNDMQSQHKESSTESPSNN